MISVHIKYSYCNETYVFSLILYKIRLRLTNRPILIALNKIDILDSSKVLSNVTASNNISVTSSQPNSFHTNTGPRRRLLRRRTANNTSTMTSSSMNPSPDSDSLMKSLTIDNKIEDWSYPRPLPEIIGIWRRRLPNAVLVPVCAMNGTGVQRLRNEIVDRLPLVRK